MVFGFVLFAIESFALYPMTRHLVRRRSQELHLAVTVLLVFTATGVLLTRDRYVDVACMRVCIYINLCKKMYMNFMLSIHGCVFRRLETA